MSKLHSPALYIMALALLMVTVEVGADQTPFPKLTGRVVDQAGILSESVEGQLSAAFKRYETQTSNQVVVATINDLGSKTIAQYGYMLGRHWGIGQEGKNKGLILLISKHDRELRIEVGYGLEGLMTDALATSIVHHTIVPFFKRGDFDGGVIAGSNQILEVLSGKKVQLPRVSSRKPERNSLLMGLMIFIFLLVFWGLPTFLRIRYGYGGSYYPGGSLGGFDAFDSFSGGFSGGGGGFGGGGGGGSW
ncbi:TPM domain-containing protein [Porticoccaceae bacterium]|nr:TPM domain-containing protein [Porticoccaceae bacterium]MDB2549412.1 TPM domain-containing protein [Porticoccaceae bacterium]